MRQFRNSPLTWVFRSDGVYDPMPITVSGKAAPGPYDLDVQ